MNILNQLITLTVILFIGCDGYQFTQKLRTGSHPNSLGNSVKLDWLGSTTYHAPISYLNEAYQGYYIDRDVSLDQSVRPEYYTTNTNEIGLCIACPYQFCNKTTTSTIRPLKLSSAFKWTLKPFGPPVLFGDALAVDLRVGNCAECGGTSLTITPVWAVCITVLSNTADGLCTQYTTSSSFTVGANKGQYYTNVIGGVGGLDVGIGFDIKLIGLRIKNNGAGRVGLSDITVDSVTGLDHCIMKSSCSNGDTRESCSYFVMGGETFFYPCITPLFNVSPGSLVGLIGNVISAAIAASDATRNYDVCV